MAVFVEVAQLSAAVAPFPTPAVSAMTAFVGVPAVSPESLELQPLPSLEFVVPDLDPSLDPASTASGLGRVVSLARQ